MIKISFAILVKDEIAEIKKLISLLVQYKQKNSEIIVVQDISETTENTKLVKDFLINEALTSNIDGFFHYEFKNNFADIKNFLNSKCSGNYIFNIDADEIVAPHFLMNIYDIIAFNLDVDLFWVPRVNIVNGLTDVHILKWGWVMTKLDQFERHAVNWPDYQGRLFKNKEEIKWTRPVHEVINGHNSHVFLPQNPEYALVHVKDIERQEKQNEHYSEINSG